MNIENNTFDYIVDNFPVWTLTEKDYLKLKSATSLFIPDKVKILPSNLKNLSLSKIVVDNKNPNFYSGNNNAIIHKATNTLILGCKNTTIPKEVRFISESAFEGCDIKEIIIPSNVRSIPPHAFYNCTNLEKLTIEKNVKKICENAFRDCVNLKEIIINEGVSEIEKSAFHNCISLEKIDFSNSLQKIAQYAFYNCKNLKENSIKEGLREIWRNEFSDTHIYKLEIPSSV